MPLNILTPIDQHTEGDDLWVFSNIETSKSLKEIDWYLNFQAYNASFENDYSTLIFSHEKLPAKAVVSVPFNGDMEAWSKNIIKAWKGLNQPSLRVFLPDAVKDINKLKLDSDLLTINVVLG